LHRSATCMHDLIIATDSGGRKRTSKDDVPRSDRGEAACRWHHPRMTRLPHVLVGVTRMKCAGTPSIHGSSPASMTGARSASVSR